MNNGLKVAIERLLDVDDVAPILGVPTRTVYVLAESRDPAERLPAIRIGRRLRFHPDDITSYIEAHRDTAAAR